MWCFIHRQSSPGKCFESQWDLIDPLYPLHPVYVSHSHPKSENVFGRWNYWLQFLIHIFLPGDFAASPTKGKVNFLIGLRFALANEVWVAVALRGITTPISMKRDFPM